MSLQHQETTAALQSQLDSLTTQVGNHHDRIVEIAQHIQVTNQDELITQGIEEELSVQLAQQNESRLQFSHYEVIMKCKDGMFHQSNTSNTNILMILLGD